MPYFLASSVDAMISSTVIFLSILSRMRCEPDLDAQAEALAAGEAHLAQELVGEQIDARVAAPEEAELALAHPLAQLEDALLVGREGVVLDLDHLHGEPRGDLLHRVEHVARSSARESRGPTWSRRRRTCTPTGSRARSSGCGYRSSRAATRACRGWRSSRGRAPMHDSAVLRGRRCRRCPSVLCPASSRVNDLEERQVALAEADGVDLG